MVWRKKFSPPGAVPGTLRPTPDTPSDVRITAIHYTPEHFTERQVTDLEAFLSDAPKDGVLWLNVAGLGDSGIVKRLGEHFGLHPLSLEDVLNVPQRPKLEDYESYEFLEFRIPMRQDVTVVPEQITLFLGASYVLTFQERQGDVFEPVRDRLRHSRGRIRRNGPDYLAYALLDAAIDGFFPVLEQLGEQLEALEEAVLSQPGRETLEALYGVRRALASLRRVMWPYREAVKDFIELESELVTEQTQLFLRDCKDHVMQVSDVLESYRELTGGLMDMCLSLQGNSMNEVMKVLTIIATIFIPLTFIAGVYGMNFDPERSPWNLPELGWYWGYPFSLALMVVSAAALVLYFRRKGWF